MKKSYPIWVLLQLFLSCQNNPKPTVSFYYWKTIFKLSTIEKEILKENDVSKLYIRYFDVDIKDNTPLPVLPIIFKDNIEIFEIVPVVFIKNEVMLNDDVNLEDLSEKIRNLINQINKKNNINCKEIQLDCDWTMRSKDNYLQFVTLFKKKYKGILSATIRLHQVKFFEKTSIPNVDKGVLMFYNMGQVAADEVNSIYDKNIGKEYTDSLKKYPLSLDIALPIYSWAVQIRSNEVIDLISKLDANIFEDKNNFETVEPLRFKVKKSLLQSGYFFKKDDIIKIELISKNNLFEMANDLSKQVKETPKEIIFYDLDAFNLRTYSNEKKIFQEVSHSF
jgi:hypothetical protein